MEINDIKELVEEIINCCYKSDEDMYWLPFENIFDNSEFNEDVVNDIKNNLNKHKDVSICGIWDYCFFILVNKYITEEENDG